MERFPEEPEIPSRCLRKIFAVQARLLAERAERGLQIGDVSVRNLSRVYEAIIVAELLDTVGPRS